MFICCDCEKIFLEPSKYTEDRGEWFGVPSYETYSGCPYCGGAFTETYECDCCGNWITGEYAEIADGSRYCEECYCVKNIGEDN